MAQPPTTGGGHLEALGVDDLISACLNARMVRPGTRVRLDSRQLHDLCTVASKVFLQEPSLLDVEIPCNVVGDIHGQFVDLLRIFEHCGFPPHQRYLFLGDYVDRGLQSLETLTLLVALKMRMPDRVLMLRGNHECQNISRIYGFYDECKRKDNIKLWKKWCDVFNCLPVAALIKRSVLCMHGGLSPHLHALAQIRGIVRPARVPNNGLLCDLLWSDPGTSDVDWVDSERGLSYRFSKKVLSQFLQKHELDLICRAHEVVEDGYQFFGDRQLVTVFSAPNYGGEFDNSGAVMVIENDMLCSFKVLKPTKGYQAKNTCPDKDQWVEKIPENFGQ